MTDYDTPPDIDACQEVTRMELVIRGPIQTRHEPHHAGHGRSFPDKRTVIGMNAWRLAWADLSDPPPHVTGPVAVIIHSIKARPASHWRKDGELTTAGKARPIPYLPDVDNVAKLVLDALKHRAFGNDNDVAILHSTKAWGAGDMVSVTLMSLDLVL